MSVMLVKGHSSSISLLHICSCIVFLSSLSQLTCPVLRIDLRFSYFFFSSRCMIFMCTKERERLCAYVCCRLFAQLHLFVLRRNVFIFVLSLKKTRKESEEKRCKKTYRIFVDFLFLFFFFFFFEICFSVFNFDRKKTHIGIGT